MVNFSGYAAVFGSPNKNGRLIKPGAFTQTLREWRERGALPPMLLEHDDDALPIGVWVSLTEDSEGLRVQGRLFALNTERGQYLSEGLIAGVFGLSMGYKVREAIHRQSITNIDLCEISLVTFPADLKARVQPIKVFTPFNETAEERDRWRATVERAKRPMPY